MKDEKKIKQSVTLFRSLIEREAAPPASKEADASGHAGTQITTPHPYYVINGRALLDGTFTGAEQMTGYQSLVLRGEVPVEVLIATPFGDEMQYGAAWPARVAAAFVEAMQVAEDNGIADEDFAVAAVPEVGLTAIWFRERHELVPLAINTARPGALDPKRVYSEAEIVERLHEPLLARFADELEEKSADGTPRPPRA